MSPNTASNAESASAPMSIQDMLRLQQEVTEGLLAECPTEAQQETATELLEEIATGKINSTIFISGEGRTLTATLRPSASLTTPCLLIGICSPLLKTLKPLIMMTSKLFEGYPYPLRRSTRYVIVVNKEPDSTSHLRVGIARQSEINLQADKPASES